jgi:hypothetical protein
VKSPTKPLFFVIGLFLAVAGVIAVFRFIIAVSNADGSALDGSKIAADVGVTCLCLAGAGACLKKAYEKTKF